MLLNNLIAFNISEIRTEYKNASLKCSHRNALFLNGARGSIVIKAIRYKPEGLVFEVR
jgi:hypothetical protein